MLPTLRSEDFLNIQILMLPLDPSHPSQGSVELPPRQANALDLKEVPSAGFGGKRRPGGVAPALDLGGPDGTKRDHSLNNSQV